MWGRAGGSSFSRPLSHRCRGQLYGRLWAVLPLCFSHRSLYKHHVLRIHPITGLDLPALVPYRTLRYATAHASAGIFVAEGPAVVARLMCSPLTIKSLLVTERWYAELAPSLDLRSESIDVFVVANDALLTEIVGSEMFNGVLAVAAIPPAPRWDDVFAKTRSPRLWVALDGLSQAENVGGIARSAAAFGADALLIGETCSPPWVRRTVRASMGTLLDLTVVPSKNLASDLHRLQEAGLTCIVADSHGSVPLTELSLTGDVCLIFGSEGVGVRPEVKEACSCIASIAMAPGIDSLNVAAAAAVFLHETARQRHPAGIER